MEHPNYKRVNKQQADATAWIFSQSHSEGQIYHYKFNQLPLNSIRIKIKYIGLTSSDRLAFNNSNGNPVVPGSQAYGQVACIGSEVGRFKIGDRVACGLIRLNCADCVQCHRGWDQLCQNVGLQKYTSGIHFGTYSSYIDINSNWVFHVPNSIPQQSVPPLISDGVSIYTALKRHTLKNKNIGILGFSSSGNLALKIAQALDVKNVTVIASSKYQQQIKNKGAQFIDIVNLSTINKRFTILFICYPQLSETQFEQSFAAVKRNGRLVLVGYSQFLNCSVAFPLLVTEQRQIIGNLTGTKEEHYETIKLAAKYKIYPEVQIIGFEQIGKKFKSVLNGEEKIHLVVKL